MKEGFNDLLDKHGLKKTTPRLSVLGVLTTRDSAISQPQLEEILGKEVDRVTLYRTLSTFEEKGIIHKVLDLNGTANYAICTSKCKEHEHHDEHLHFNCTQCNSIYCLNDMHLPEISLPRGFKSTSVNLIVYGLCKNCSKGQKQS